MNKYYIAKVVCTNHSGDPAFGFALLPMFTSLVLLRKEYPEPIGYFEWEAPEATIEFDTVTKEITKI